HPPAPPPVRRHPALVPLLPLLAAALAACRGPCRRSTSPAAPAPLGPESAARAEPTALGPMRVRGLGPDGSPTWPPAALVSKTESNLRDHHDYEPTTFERVFPDTTLDVSRFGPYEPGEEWGSMRVPVPYPPPTELVVRVLRELPISGRVVDK